MVRRTGFRLALGLVLVVRMLFLSVTACCQSRDSVLTQLDETYLDSLAARAVKRIRRANLEEKEPKVLVIDFFRGSPGNSSRLGTSLADRFYESLTAYSIGLNILDRRILKDSRVPSSRPLCGGFDLPLVFIDPRLRELIELV